MFDHLRDTIEDGAVGVVMTAEIFRNFDKSWITVGLGGIYLLYKIYTQHLKAKTEKAKEETERAKEETERAKEEKEQLQKEMFNKQLEAWGETKAKVEADLKINAEALSKRYERHK